MTNFDVPTYRVNTGVFCIADLGDPLDRLPVARESHGFVPRHKTHVGEFPDVFLVRFSDWIRIHNGYFVFRGSPDTSLWSGSLPEGGSPYSPIRKRSKLAAVLIAVPVMMVPMSLDKTAVIAEVCTMSRVSGPPCSLWPHRTSR